MPNTGAAEPVSADTHVYSIIYCSALKEDSCSPSNSFFSLVMPDCKAHHVIVGPTIAFRLFEIVTTVGHNKHQPACATSHPPDPQSYVHSSCTSARPAREQRRMQPRLTAQLVRSTGKVLHPPTLRGNRGCKSAPIRSCTIPCTLGL